MAIAAFPALGTACTDPCVNEVIEVKQASEAGPQAVLFRRNCHATTGFNLQVSVVKAGEQPAGTGNAFIADDGDLVTGADGRLVELYWHAADHLVVIHHPNARIFKQESGVADVRISYEHQPL